MSESIAFLRLVWSRDRQVVAALVAASVAGTMVSVVAAKTLPNDELSFMPTATLRGIAVGSMMLLTIVPALVASLGLFNFQVNEEDLESPQSCCSHWLLRMPIKSWKIVIVPVVLKTLWISLCWPLLTIPIQMLNQSAVIPWAEPSLGFSAIAICFLAVSWRPFRGGWWRAGALVIAGVVSIALIYLSFVRVHSIDESWKVLGMAGVVVAYAFAIWLLLHSFQLARTHATGIVPSSLKRISRLSTSVRSDPNRIDHRGTHRALMWHDLQRAKRLSLVVFGMAFLPLLVFVSCLGLNGATIFMAFVGTAVAAWSLIAGSMHPLNQRSGPVLPVYLIASPIASYRIAWTRLATSLIIQLPFVLVSSVVMAGWALLESNRVSWMQWAHSATTELGLDGDVFWNGLRISIAIVLGTVVVMHGRITAMLWISMNGRDWMAGLFGCIIALLIFGAILVPMSWFFRYDNIDDVKSAAMWWLSVVPLIVTIVLGLKLLFAAIATGMLVRKRLAPVSAVWRVLAIWAALVALVGILIHVLVPDPRVTLLICLSAAAVSVPLGSVLWMPISVDGDRHR